MPRVAAIQMPLFRSESLVEFHDRVDTLVSQAVRQGAQLVALPAHVGLCLFQTDLTDLRVNPLELTRATRGGLRQAFENQCGNIAARHKIYLAAGTAYMPINDRVYHVAYLFGPDGKVAGAQAQTHRSPRDRAWGLDLADALAVYETPVGRIGFLVGADLYYPEVARILCLQGANILIHPGERPQFSMEERLGALWREVQANQVFGLEPCVVGRLAAQDLRGPSAALAPCEITPGQAGVLGETESESATEVLVADFDFDALARVHGRNDLYRSFNVDLYTTHLAPAMRDYRGEGR